MLHQSTTCAIPSWVASSREVTFRFWLTTFVLTVTEDDGELIIHKIAMHLGSRYRPDVHALTGTGDPVREHMAHVVEMAALDSDDFAHDCAEAFGLRYLRDGDGAPKIARCAA